MKITPGFSNNWPAWKKSGTVNANKYKQANENSKGKSRPQRHDEEDNSSQDSEAYQENPTRKRRAKGTR